MDKQQIIEAIEQMNVLELADLVKALEEKFGVSAAAAVVAAIAPPPVTTFFSASLLSELLLLAGCDVNVILSFKEIAIIIYLLLHFVLLML